MLCKHGIILGTKNRTVDKTQKHRHTNVEEIFYYWLYNIKNKPRHNVYNNNIIIF